MKELMGSFQHILEDHHDDELVTEAYANAIGLSKSQIEKYLIQQHKSIDEYGIKYFWKSEINNLFEMDFIQDEIELTTANRVANLIEHIYDADSSNNLSIFKASA